MTPNFEGIPAKLSECWDAFRRCSLPQLPTATINPGDGASAAPTASTTDQ
jgi:hypothetical protein